MLDTAKRVLAALDRWSLRHRVVRVGRRAVEGFLNHEALQYAGSMAYFAILSIFQLLVLGIITFSFFLGRGSARDFVLTQIRLNTPIDADTMGRVLDNVIQSRGGVSIVGLILLVWGALGVFSAMSRGVVRAFGGGEDRPFLQDKLLGLGLMALTGLLALAAVVVGVVTAIVQSAAADVMSAVPGGETALQLFGALLPLVLVFLALLIIYRVVPTRHVSLREIWPGAVVGALLWSVLRFGFTYYATRVARYDTAFGPISTGISLLVFLYFASVVLLFGAEVSRANVRDVERRRASDQ